MAPADNIRQRDQRVIRKFEKKKGRHRKMKKNVKRLIAGAVVLLVAAGIVVRIAGGNKKDPCRNHAVPEHSGQAFHRRVS